MEFKVCQICSVLDCTTTTPSTSDPPANKILEGLYKSKLQDSTQHQTTLALYNEEAVRSGGEPEYRRLRMCVKLQMIRF